MSTEPEQWIDEWARDWPLHQSVAEAMRRNQKGLLNSMDMQHVMLRFMCENSSHTVQWERLADPDVWLDSNEGEPCVHCGSPVQSLDWGMACSAECWDAYCDEEDNS